MVGMLMCITSAACHPRVELAGAPATTTYAPVSGGTICPTFFVEVPQMRGRPQGEALIDQLARSMQRAGSRSHLRRIAAAPGDVRMVVSYVENEDDHTLATLAKIAVVSLSVFVLSPVVPFDYDYSFVVTARIVREEEGAALEYQSRSAGTARGFTYWDAVTGSHRNATRGRVMEDALQDLGNQLVRAEASLCR